MEKITTTAEETKKYIKGLGGHGEVMIGNTSLQILADIGAMDWFYFRKVDEFAEFIDGNMIRYGDVKQKITDGTLTFALIKGEVLGYIAIPTKVDIKFRYMVAIKAGVINGLD